MDIRSAKKQKTRDECRINGIFSLWMIHIAFSFKFRKYNYTFSFDNTFAYF